MTKFETNLYGSLCNLESDMFKNILEDKFKFKIALQSYYSILENNNITNNIEIPNEEFAVFYNRDLFSDWKTDKIINSNNGIKIEILKKTVNGITQFTAIPNKLIYYK